ncbi:MAG TPA: ATP-dependent DNA ligase [Tepidisphaeraceae bacterium]|nr:ATP-dependent DNA ligase [Tepidisphaeraceae bacterium]
MKRFTELFQQLDATTRTSEKVEAMQRYFREAPPADAAWAVYVLAGRTVGKAIASRKLREWASEASGHPAWLVDESYHVVGDLSETLSLIVPGATDGEAAPSLHDICDGRLRPLGQMTQEQQRATIEATWAQLSAEQRLVFHKLLGGEFRIGVSKLLLVRALAGVAGVEPAVVTHRLSGSWMPTAEAMVQLLSPHEEGSPTARGLPYPFMLANPFHEPLGETLGSIADWQIEWKWDGIRAQILRRAGQIAIWSRGDELITSAFPELVQAASALPEGTVLDGEILAWDRERPLPFLTLQQRINRKNVEMSFWPDVPVIFIAFDMLERDGIDVRTSPLADRRAMLEALVPPSDKPQLIRLAEPLRFESWDAITRQLDDCRKQGTEGVMLKQRSSAYVPGRPTGLWWKKKIDPYTMDAVLIAAEPGRGRRAGLLSAYTFGVWDEQRKLVPITKAYSGLTDQEMAEVDRFARKHTLARHGPVHSVEPLLVFEIGFEAIQQSTRHKSGIAVRFPRMLRMRKDKAAADADTLATMRDLLRTAETMR